MCPCTPTFKHPNWCQECRIYWSARAPAASVVHHPLGRKWDFCVMNRKGSRWTNEHWQVLEDPWIGENESWKNQKSSVWTIQEAGSHIVIRCPKEKLVSLQIMHFQSQSQWWYRDQLKFKHWPGQCSTIKGLHTSLQRQNRPGLR